MNRSSIGSAEVCKAIDLLLCNGASQANCFREIKYGQNLHPWDQMLALHRRSKRWNQKLDDVAAQWLFLMPCLTAV